MPRPPSLLVALGLLAAVALGADLPKAYDLAVLYKPYRTDRATLAPDGRHLAYTVKEGKQLSLVIVDVDKPEEKVSLLVGEDRIENIPLPSSPMRVLTVVTVSVGYLRWVKPTRLVYLARGIKGSGLELRVVDADGRNNTKIADGETFEFTYTPPSFDEGHEYVETGGEKGLLHGT